MALTRAWLATVDGSAIIVWRATWFSARECAATLLGVDPGRVNVRRCEK